MVWFNPEHRLDEVRRLIRQYWRLRSEGKFEEAERVLVNELPEEVETQLMRPSAGIGTTEEEVQRIFFEEKRRFEDVSYIVEEVAKRLEKMEPSGLKEQARNLVASEPVGNRQEKVEQVTKARPQVVGQSDIASMIDRMLAQEEERLKD